MKIPLFLAVLALTGCAGALDDVTRGANVVEAIASPASRALDNVYEARLRECTAVPVATERGACVNEVRRTFADVLDQRDVLAMASADLAALVSALGAQGGTLTAEQVAALAAGMEALVIAEGRFFAAKRTVGVK